MPKSPFYKIFEYAEHMTRTNMAPNLTAFNVAINMTTVNMTPIYKYVNNLEIQKWQPSVTSYTEKTAICPINAFETLILKFLDCKHVKSTEGALGSTQTVYN